VRFSICIASSSEQRIIRLLSALRGGDVSALHIAAGAANAEVLAPLFRAPPDVVEEISTTISSPYTGNLQEIKTAKAEKASTRFGGIFLLLPFISSLPIETVAQNWPDPENASAYDLLRFLILIKCCGRSRAMQVFSDPLVRDLMGITPSITLPRVASWLSAISNSHIEEFLRGLAKWHHDTGVLVGDAMVLTSVPLPGKPAAVLFDYQRGVWLYVGGWDPVRPEHVVRRLGMWIEKSGVHYSAIFCDKAFLEGLPSSLPNFKAKRMNRIEDVLMVDSEREAPVCIDRFPEDLSYVSFPTTFHVSRSVDLGISVAAQGVMRAFAWRLPGFAGSSLQYLYNNFLDFGASVEEEFERRIVRLSNPPLNVVLNMTGMARKTYRLSWLDERSLVLVQEGSSNER
jgi:hypothetical protein